MKKIQNPCAVDLSMLVILGFFFLVVFLVGGVFVFSHLKQAKLEDAERLIEKGQYHEAIGVLERLLEDDERDPQKNFLLAFSHEKSGGTQNAILHYRRILKFGRWNAAVTEIHVRRRLAECLRITSNLTEAKNEYLILTKLDPNSYENYYEAGLLFQKGRAFPNALKFFKQAAALNPHHFGTFSGMGRVLFAMNMYTEAKEALARAAEIDPGDRENLYYLGQTHRFLGEHKEAIAAFDQAERDAGVRVKAMLAKALIRIDTGDYSGAMIDLERGLSFAEEKSEAWCQIHYLIAGLSERAKDLGKAIEHWEIIYSTNAGYRDVASKLKQFEEFGANDQIKELLIAGRMQFEMIARKMAEKMGLRPINILIHSDAMITLTCNEIQSIQKNARMQNVLLRIYREMSPVSEVQVREFHDMMKGESAMKGIYMTVGEFAPSAVEYASNRPIDLMDGSAIIPVIRGAIG